MDYRLLDQHDYCRLGAVTLIFYLAKGIKADKASKNDFK